MDIQVFFRIPVLDICGRLHLMKVPDDAGNYKPYEGFRWQRETRTCPAEGEKDKPFTLHSDLSCGYKGIHFDAWVAKPSFYSPFLAVTYYFHKWQKLGKWPQCVLVHKSIYTPDLLRTLSHVRFEKQMAKERAKPSGGLGALFG